MPDRTILVIEDQKALADLYAEWLSDRYEVLVANTATEAYDLLSESIDVALVDRRLPDASGDEIVTEIRERDLNCPVAMVTAVDPDFDILELGFDSYVVKPISGDELKDLVSKLLERREYTDDLRSYYALAEKRAAIEARKSPEELEASAEYQSLVNELETIEYDLDERVETLDDEDYHALFHQL